MRRFQMLLDDDLDEALEREALASGVSKAALLRRFARQRLGALPPIEEDPLWSLVGVDRTEDGDGSPVDLDEVIYGSRDR